MSRLPVRSLAAAMLFFFCGCVCEPSGAEYFAGQLSVCDDTVRLCDCATGRIHPIVQNTMRTEAVARYEKFGTEVPQTIFMACKGRLVDSRANTPDSLHIDRLLSLGLDESEHFLLVGLYECETDSRRKILHLKPDRTFSSDCFRQQRRKQDRGSVEPDLRIGTGTSLRIVPPASLRNSSEPRNAGWQQHSKRRNGLPKGLSVKQDNGSCIDPPEPRHRDFSIIGPDSAQPTIKGALLQSGLKTAIRKRCSVNRFLHHTQATAFEKYDTIIRKASPPFRNTKKSEGYNKV